MTLILYSPLDRENIKKENYRKIIWMKIHMQKFQVHLANWMQQEKTWYISSPMWVYQEGECGLTLDMQLPILTGYGRKIKQLPQ